MRCLTQLERHLQVHQLKLSLVLILEGLRQFVLELLSIVFKFPVLLVQIIVYRLQLFVDCLELVQLIGYVGNLTLELLSLLQ